MGIIKADNSKIIGEYLKAPRLSKKQFMFFKRLVINNYIESYVIHKHTKAKIFLNDKKGVKHSLNSRGSLNKTKAYTVLKEVVKYSFLTDISENKKNKVLGVYLFQNIVIVDTNVYKIKITVKEKEVNGKLIKYLYHYDLFLLKE
ncbi:MAG: hypothetical protein K0B10_07235 [Vicingaceae bacterium]|nr:hypothetical protein [Vicingaceae bacterium]